MSKFQSLTVNKIVTLTESSVQISFDISNNSDFNFISGQYITIKHFFNNEDVRRAYSICSSLNDFSSEDLLTITTLS